MAGARASAARSGPGDRARRLPGVSDPGELGYRDILRIPEFRAAVVGTFVIMMGFGIVSPILPLYARSFGVSLDAVGVLIAAFSVTRLATDPFAGVIIDRLVERGAAVVGAMVVGATTALAAVAPTTIHCSWCSAAPAVPAPRCSSPACSRSSCARSPVTAW